MNNNLFAEMNDLQEGRKTAILNQLYTLAETKNLDSRTFEIVLKTAIREADEIDRITRAEVSGG